MLGLPSALSKMLSNKALQPASTRLQAGTSLTGCSKTIVAYQRAWLVPSAACPKACEWLCLAAAQVWRARQSPAFMSKECRRTYLEHIGCMRMRPPGVPGNHHIQKTSLC